MTVGRCPKFETFRMIQKDVTVVKELQSWTSFCKRWRNDEVCLDKCACALGFGGG